MRYPLQTTLAATRVPPPLTAHTGSSLAGGLEQPFEPSSFVGLMQQLNMNDKRFSGNNPDAGSQTNYRQLRARGSDGGAAGARRRTSPHGSRGSRRGSSRSRREQTPESEALQILDRYPFRPNLNSTPGSRPPISLSRLISRALASAEGQERRRRVGQPASVRLPFQLVHAGGFSCCGQDGSVPSSSAGL